MSETRNAFPPPELRWLPRGLVAVRCSCGGYAGKVDSTTDECREHGCGRDRPGDECCSASFLCVICGTRWAGSYEAPELGW
jgi:hypothetical protein